MSHLTKIKSIENLTHDVLRVVLDKPDGLNYIPGQAADIALNKPGWSDKKNCFTFTSLPEDDEVEFTIKTYPDHHGMTNELLSAQPGDEVLIYDSFGDIYFKGPGMFIAGGAGVTPFIAMIKDLEKQNRLNGNKLIFANKGKDDIILEDYFKSVLDGNFINVLSNEDLDGYEHGYISPEIIKKYDEDELKFYYLCGPPPMMEAVEGHLHALGIASEFIVKESF